MLKLRLAECPVSWGVERGDAVVNPRWDEFLDAVAGLGYSGVELGPLGFLPGESDELLAALRARRLELSAGYLMAPLAERDQRPTTIEVCRSTCQVLAAAGADCLIIIDALNRERSAAAGRSDRAPRLDDRAFGDLAITTSQVARIAAEDYGLTPVFHPHVGTNVEFRDDIDRLFGAVDPDLLRLCLDSGHSTYAGIDPDELSGAYSDRLGYLHLKDVDVGVLQGALREHVTFEVAVRRGVFCPLGDGMVDFRRLFANLDTHGYEGWAAVEQDRSEPTKPISTLPMLDDAARSLAYLAEMQLVEKARVGTGE